MPPRLHGRAFAAYNGIRNGAELGALALGGVLVAVLGPRGTLWFAGRIAALSSVVGLLILPDSRRQPSRRDSAHGPNRWYSPDEFLPMWDTRSRPPHSLPASKATKRRRSCWRLNTLTATGYDLDDAVVIASHVEIDLREAAALVRRPCPSATTVRILV